MKKEDTTSLRLAFYGDDFTGSTDALEVLAFAGLRCALFLKAPSVETLNELNGLDAIGIAGDSRGMSPLEMETKLPPIFEALVELNVPIVHYKVCSTFDSSPTIGSIGRAMDIGRRTFRSPFIPVVAGTPALARYCVFGNLFARSATDGLVHRIDRHPIMRSHPVTPMDESDLTLHLGRQTTLSIGNFVLPNFEAERAVMDKSLMDHTASRPDAVLFDTTTHEHLTEVGRMIDAQARQFSPVFVVGSSGVEYALTQWWQELYGKRPSTNDYDTFVGVDQVLAISGSASPLSALQIDEAITAGFSEIAIDAGALVDDSSWQASLGVLVSQVVTLLQQGRSVILHTARGPRDARIAAMIDSLVRHGYSTEQAKHQGGRLLGMRLGAITDAVLRAIPIRRLLLSGGDTSSQITQILAPDALEIQARLAPGAPLCRVISKQQHLRGLEIALKGGQMGDKRFFVHALRGNA